MTSAGARPASISRNCYSHVPACCADSGGRTNGRGNDAGRRGSTVCRYCRGGCKPVCFFAPVASPVPLCHTSPRWVHKQRQGKPPFTLRDASVANNHRAVHLQQSSHLVRDRVRRAGFTSATDKAILYYLYTRNHARQHNRGLADRNTDVELYTRYITSTTLTRCAPCATSPATSSCRSSGDCPEAIAASGVTSRNGLATPDAAASRTLFADVDTAQQ